jgi:hypothetical protein
MKPGPIHGAVGGAISFDRRCLFDCASAEAHDADMDDIEPAPTAR